MKLHKSISYLLAVSLISGHVMATPPSRIVSLSTASDAHVLELKNEYDRLLRNLGIDDFSGKAKESLENGRHDQVGKEVLKTNIERYAFLNDVRELSTFVLSKVIAEMESATPDRRGELEAKLVQLAQKSWFIKPLEMTNEFPNDIETIKDSEVRKERKEAYADRIARSNADYSKRQLVADIIETVYGYRTTKEILDSGNSENREQLIQEIAKIEQHADKFISATYNDLELGTTRWLSRGLVYGIIKHSADEKAQGRTTELESKLRNKFREAGQNIDNLVTAKLEVVDADGSLKSVEIETGDTLNESSKEGKESYKMASAVMPKFWSSMGAYFRGVFKGLWANPFAYFLLTDTEKTFEKLENGQPINIKERLAHWVSQFKATKLRSFTHAGKAIVFEDASSGIKAVMAVDMYPNQGPGGVRVIGLEGFGLENAEYSQVGVTKFDYRKMQALGKEQLEKNGDSKVIWTGKAIKWDSKNGQYVESDKEENISLSESENKKRIALLELSPAEYKARFQERFKQFSMDALYGKNPVGFAYGFIDSTRAMYCAQFNRIADKFAGFTDTMVDSRFTLMHIMLKKMKFKEVADLDLNKPLTPPNFAATNNKLVMNASLFKQDGFVRIVNYDWNNNEYEQILNKHEPKREAMSAKTMALVAEHLKTNFAESADDFSVRSGVYTSQNVLMHAVKNAELLGFNFSMFSNRNNRNAYLNAQGDNDGAASDKNNRIQVGSEAMAEQVNPYENEAWIKEMREFLFAIGLDDIAVKIKKEIATNGSMDPLSKMQQQKNIDIYNGLNAGRELALYLFAQLRGRLHSENQLNLLSDFTARMLSLQPNNPDRNLPLEISSMPANTKEEIEKKERVTDAYIASQVRTGIEQMARDITADGIRLLFGDNSVRFLDPKFESADANEMMWAKRIQEAGIKIFGFAKVVAERTYMDTQAGSTKWLGRSLTMIMAREAEKMEPNKNVMDTALMKNLAYHVENQGLKLSQFIGDKVVALNEKQQFIELPVKTGDFALYRSDSAEAGVISAGWIPSNDEKAKRLNLNGNILTTLLDVGVEKAADGLSLVDRGLQFLSRNKLAGNSHIGFYKVFDAKSVGSNIKMVMVMDNFPTPIADITEDMRIPGGVRLIGPETFNDSAHDTALTVGGVDQAKLGQMSFELILKNGLPKKGQVIFPAHKIILDENGQPKRPEANADGSYKKPEGGWKFEHDPEELMKEVRKIQQIKNSGDSVALKKAYEEFGTLLQARADAKKAEFITRGTFFLWVSPRGAYYENSGYCTFLDLSSWFAANGINPEFVPSKPAFATKAATWIGQQAEALLGKLEPKPGYQRTKHMLKSLTSLEPIMQGLTLKRLPLLAAPNSMLTQDYVHEKDVKRVFFPNMSVGVRERTTVGEYRSRNAAITRALEKLLPRKDYKAVGSRDPLEMIAVVEHMKHLNEFQRADNGQLPESKLSKIYDSKREAIPRSEPSVKSQSVQNTDPKIAPVRCEGIFKIAG